MNLSALTFPLSETERGELYSRLAGLGARVFETSEGAGGLDDLNDEEVLAAAGEESRFDFRLLYVLVALLAESFHRFHPFRLRAAGRSLRSPAVWGVILEFARSVNPSPDLNDFAAIVTRDLKPARPQLYWTGLRKPRPQKLARTTERTPDEFFGWGFFCDEVPILKELSAAPPRKRYSPDRRKGILRALLREKGSVKVSDYLSALENCITRQQAHRDLVSTRGVRAFSDRRGRTYRMARSAGTKRR